MQAKVFLLRLLSPTVQVSRDTTSTVRDTDARTAFKPIGTPDLLPVVGIPLRWPATGVPLYETSDVAVGSTVFVEPTTFPPLFCDGADQKYARSRRPRRVTDGSSDYYTDVPV